MLTEARVLSHQRVAAATYLLELEAPELAQAAKPGQFVNLRIPDNEAMVLRRPISLHDIDAEHGMIRLLYLVAGGGTQRLTALNEGDAVDLLGPLGHGFSTEFAGTRAVVIGGGIGVAPLLPLVKSLHAAGKSVKLLLGARNKDALTDTAAFAPYVAAIAIATDDGSAGCHGFVTELLTAELEAAGADFIYACGPKPMLRAVESVAAEHGVAGEISTEERMGCGLGVCLSCAATAKDGSHRKVCADGPVFPLGVLAYD